MASIDKIHGTQEQYAELKEWVKKDKTINYALRYFYGEDGYDPEKRVIASFPANVDEYLIRFCPLPFVCVRLREQYGTFEEIKHQN